MLKDKKTLLIFLVFFLVAGTITFLVLEKESEDEPEEIKEAEEKSSLQEIVEGFLGAPYERGPLGEGGDEALYREDVFDCTTLVLVSASNLHSNDLSPEEMIEKINYFPPREVSYETRLHFSTYRNKVSEFFEDITREVAPDLYKEKEVLLNKERPEEGRLIDIDWEEKIIIPYIKAEEIPQIVSELPEEAGVAFLIDGDEEMGLDIRHEGFLFSGEEFIHASLKNGKVFKEDFLGFLKESDYDAVNFFRVNY